MAQPNIETLFTYHPPKENQPQRYEELRGAALAFAKTIIKNCPQSPDRDQAITKVREAVMMANASIAVYEGISNSGGE